jgi:hypothetical protein
MPLSAATTASLVAPSLRLSSAIAALPALKATRMLAPGMPAAFSCFPRSKNSSQESPGDAGRRLNHDAPPVLAL